MARRFVVALFFGVLFSADLVPLLATEPSPLDVFRKFYREKSPELRLKAVAQLSGVRGAEVVEALFDALGDADRSVRERAAGVLAEPRAAPDEIAAMVRIGLGKQPPEIRALAARALAAAGDKALRQLRTALDDPQAEVKQIAARSLAFLGDRTCAPKLSELIAAKEPLVRATACEALGVLLGPEAVGTAQAVVLGDSAPEPRIAALEVLGRYPRPETAEQAGRALNDRSWSVRVAACSALGSFRCDAESARSAVAPLVRAIQDERRLRVRLDMAEALFCLTGIDFGPEPDRWKAWFAEAGRTFSPPAARPKRGAAAPGATQSHLLDLPLESEHVAFVLDYSHSMNDPLRFGAEETKRAALVRSLGVVLGRIPANGFFNVVTYGTLPQPYKPALFAATPASRQGAVRFVDKLVPDGRTNMYDAVEIALADAEADTIVLLSDGAPNEGKRRTRTAILAGIRELNRYRLARIHTVEVGAMNTSPRWKGFMKEIADATGGSHLQR